MGDITSRRLGNLININNFTRNNIQLRVIYYMALYDNWFFRGDIHLDELQPKLEKLCLTIN